jgi:dipeptidyl-peptidase-4
VLLVGGHALDVAHGQDRLARMPGYERYEKMRREATNTITPGALTVTWRDGGRAVEYARSGRRFRYDIEHRTETELSAASKSNDGDTKDGDTNSPPGRASARKEPSERRDRGRQLTRAVSPDGQWRASYRDHNVWLTATNDTNAIAVTTEGSADHRLKFGTASWVYGEELDQTTSMWWSPDSRKLAFYRFDEQHVADFHLALRQTKLHTSLDSEPYPKAGETNPIVDLVIYDVASKQSVRVDVRDGVPFSNGVVGHYVYGVSWTKDSRELLFHRTDRRQKTLELAAADPVTGKCRVVVREEWPPSWTENSPDFQFLKDGRRFIWSSERTGWKNYYLYELTGKLLATLTAHPFEVAGIVRADESADPPVLYYLARSGDNPMKVQLHRVRLEGTGDERLTDPQWHHAIDLAPDGRHFIDVAQAHDVPPWTTLRDQGGGCVAELARADATRFRQLGLKTVELLQFKAADGQTDLYGMLHFPSRFWPGHKYPLLVSVYAGPATTAARETFVPPNPLTEFGFLVATFDSRSAGGRGKRSLDAIYQQLGRAELDDQAAGVRALGERRYVDRNRVGIFGTSYGGTAAALCLMRYPDLFRAACASSAVTDFRNYDSIYTERYLGLPQENKEAYDAVSVLTHVKQLRGRLMLFYGTADNNVHPNNTLQLVQALTKEGKSFEVQVGPDQGHEGLNRNRMMEFFIERLVLDRR